MAMEGVRLAIVGRSFVRSVGRSVGLRSQGKQESDSRRCEVRCDSSHLRAMQKGSPVSRRFEFWPRKAGGGIDCEPFGVGPPLAWCLIALGGQTDKTSP